jgi:hypothetical protein
VQFWTHETRCLSEQKTSSVDMVGIHKIHLVLTNICIKDTDFNTVYSIIIYNKFAPQIGQAPAVAVLFVLHSQNLEWTVEDRCHT